VSTVMIKAGGVGAALAGVLVICQTVSDIAIVDIAQRGTVESAFRSASALLLVFGLIGMHLRQQHAAGVFGEIATLVALLGSATVFGMSLPEVTILPALPKDSPLLQQPPSALLPVLIGSFVVYVVGLLLFGVATWRARVLPRPAALVLVIGVLLGTAAAPIVPGILALIGVALIWLGAATVVPVRSVPPAVERPTVAAPA
jgi:hypothetical protein